MAWEGIGTRVGDPVNFKLQVEKWCTKAENITIEGVRAANVAIAQLVVSRTPVLTGWLRDSWYAALNRAPEGSEGVPNPMVRIKAVARRMQLKDTFRLGNVAPYARRQEFGYHDEDSMGRTYNTPGKYFVRRTLTEAPAVANATLAAVARRMGGGR